MPRPFQIFLSGVQELGHCVARHWWCLNDEAYKGTTPPSVTDTKAFVDCEREEARL